MRRLQEDGVHPTYALPELELLIESSNGPVMTGAAGGGICRAASPIPSQARKSLVVSLIEPILSSSEMVSSFSFATTLASYVSGSN